MNELATEQSIDNLISIGYSDINLYCLSALKENSLDFNSVDLFITSPPYNVGIEYNSTDDNNQYEAYLEFTKQWLCNCYLWGKSGARMCLNIPLDKNKGGVQSVGADFIQIAKSIGWKYHTTIIWNESNISRRTAWGSWLSASAPYVIAPVELIVILYKDTWKKHIKALAILIRMNF